MNVLEIRIENRVGEGGITREGLAIYIDGTDLLLMLENHLKSIDYEEKLVDEVWCYEFGENYINLLLNGTPEDHEGIEIYDCTCGNPGCCPISIQVKVKEENHIWCKFEVFGNVLDDFDSLEFISSSYIDEIAKLIRI